ncbi:MAG: hypothetical protein B7Z80_13435 [Rhodospirillales bacterium 20-64-7]|nr:MAG: hypothetical protein B7Z80_13435 [Rhodospirillales bacterium 20-64-7]
MAAGQAKSSPFASFDKSTKIIDTIILDSHPLGMVITPIPERPGADLINHNTTFVLGAPRSGTTWLAKILDSHPSVLYRHEPDTTIYRHALPIVSDPTLTQDEIGRLHELVRLQIAHRDIKTTCSLPIFRKQADTAASFYSRVAAAVSLKALSRVLPRTAQSRLALPTGLDRPKHEYHLVAKSVSSLGRADLLAGAFPDARFILIIRNALGQVASRLLGIRSGKMPSAAWNAEMLHTQAARRYGLDTVAMANMPIAARLAWEWAVMNEKALDDLRPLNRSRVIRYVDLADDTIGCSQRLLGFLGLPWVPQVEEFVRTSSRSTGPDGYYSVRKDAQIVKRKWAAYLTADEQAQILEVMRLTHVGLMYPELIDRYTRPMPAADTTDRQPS